MEQSFISCLRPRGIGLAALIAGIAFSTPVAAKLHIPLLSRPAQQHAQSYGLDAWRLRIVISSFSGNIQCRLATKNGKMIYAANALGISFGKHAPVMDAWVKIDDAAAVRWRDMLPELARLKVTIDGRDMDSPTDGMLWLPIPAIGQAGQIAIQLRPNQKPKLFSLAHFAELHDAGRRLGCEPEARFIR